MKWNLLHCYHVVSTWEHVTRTHEHFQLHQYPSRVQLLLDFEKMSTRASRKGVRSVLSQRFPHLLNLYDLCAPQAPPPSLSTTTWHPRSTFSRYYRKSDSKASIRLFVLSYSQHLAYWVWFGCNYFSALGFFGLIIRLQLFLSTWFLWLTCQHP